MISYKECTKECKTNPIINLNTSTKIKNTDNIYKRLFEVHRTTKVHREEFLIIFSC